MVRLQHDILSQKSLQVRGDHKVGRTEKHKLGGDKTRLKEQGELMEMTRQAYLVTPSYL